MSFWKNSPGPTWSDWFWSNVTCEGIPHVFPIQRTKLPLPVSDNTIRIVREQEIPELCEFLTEHFQVTQKSVCSLNTQDVQNGIDKGWVVVIAQDDAKKIIGCLMNWPLDICHFRKKAKYSIHYNAGFMNFFCVHPEYRKSGLGSELLHYMIALLSQKGKFIHFFQKELSPLWMLPYVSHGRYIAREIQPSFPANDMIEEVNVKEYFKDHIEFSKRFTILFQPKKITGVTTLYKYDCGTYVVYLAVAKIFHKHRNGGEIGEVLFFDYKTENPEVVTSKNIAAGIEEILEHTPYTYIIMDESIPYQEIRGWKKDAPYYTYCYNVNPRHFGNVPIKFWF